MAADTTITMLPWIADSLEHPSDPDLSAEHERALAMRYHRFEQGRGDYGDLLDIPRHLAHLGRYDDLAEMARQATQAIGGTLAVAAYLADIRPLVPGHRIRCPWLGVPAPSLIG
jgi:hypothetical protein